MPDPDTDRLVSDLRGSITDLGTTGNPLTAPALALGKLGDRALDAKDAVVSKARSFADDLGDHIRSYFTSPPSAPSSAGRDIELPPDKPKRLAKPRALAGGRR